MKILFLPNNTASLMSANIQGLNELGVSAIGFNFAPKVFQSKTNIISISSNENLLIRLYENIKFLVFLLYHFCTASHIHWMYGSKSKIAKVLTKLIHFSGKKRIVEFCGSDVRSIEKMCSDIEFYNIERFQDIHKKQLGTQKSSDDTQSRFSRNGFLAIFNSIELIDYVNKNFFPSFYTYNRSIIISDIINEVTEENPKNKTPKIVHIPSNPLIKGTDEFLTAVMKLRNEGIADYEMITGVSHKEALSKIQAADIVVDQLIIGEYGVLSIEAMALKKPTVCFIRPKLWSQYLHNFIECPIINANITNIYEVLKDLALKSPAQRQEIGDKGFEYVCKYHSHTQNAKRLFEIYKSI